MDTEELERRRQFNQTFENRHAQANSEIDALNDFARAQRASYFEETEKLYRQGEYRKAIPRLMANTQGDPRHRLARALLVAALVAELPRLETPDWAREEIAWQIRRESKQTLALMKEELTAFAQKPECEVDATLYLAWIALRLGNGEEGGALAKRLTERDPDRGFYWRVRFEAALIAARESEVSEALAGVERTLGPDAVETLHARGRAALIRGDFGQAVAIYANLAKAQSGRARFHYLLATALVEQGEASGRVEKMRAMRHFRKAIDLAVEPAERTVYEMAWRAAQTRLQPVVYRTE